MGIKKYGATIIRWYFVILRHGIKKKHPVRRVVNIGSEYGGWAIPADFKMKADDCVLLAGAGEDISFDIELQKKFHCRCVTVDPTPRAISHYEGLMEAIANSENYYTNAGGKYQYEFEGFDIEKMTFLPYGISNISKVERFYFPQNDKHVSCSINNLQNTSKYFEAECKTYDEIKRLAGGYAFRLVKLDIEGSEYGVINDILRSGDIPEILCVDFDEGYYSTSLLSIIKVVRIIRKLRMKGLQPVHIVGNDVTFVLI